jgi:hypothetical protein
MYICVANVRVDLPAPHFPLMEVSGVSEKWQLHHPLSGSSEGVRGLNFRQSHFLLAHTLGRPVKVAAAAGQGQRSKVITSWLCLLACTACRDYSTVQLQTHHDGSAAT